MCGISKELWSAGDRPAAQMRKIRKIRKLLYPLSFKGSNMAPPVFLEYARQVLGKHLEYYPPADPTAGITGTAESSL